MLSAKLRLERLLLALCFSSTCVSQVAIQGTVNVAGYSTGGMQVNYPFTHNVKIMAVFPPPYSSISTSDYANFTNDVMPQPYVDGVTIELDWANIETQWPSTPCAPINTDTCQLDAAGVYHNYSWTAIYDQNATTGNPLGIWQWFNSFGGTLKTVNFILAGINISGSVNTATPDYVTSASYASNFPTPYNRQDVMNTVLDCPTSLAWKGVSGATLTASGTTITVSALNCCTSGSSSAFQNNDTVWVTGGSGTSTNYNTTLPSTPPWTTGGAAITVTGSSQFTYSVASAPAVGTCSGCVYITTSQSTPVPYELPYVTAWEAFMHAASLHFNPNYKINGTTIVGANGTNQLGYVRSGTWVGGESFAECISGGTLNGLTGLPAPYAFTTSPNNTWLVDYQNKVSYIQSVNPTMQRLWPVDNGTLPDSMAAIAVAAGNGAGYINGFGSQGLSLLDQCPPGNSADDWCNLFTNTTTNYFARGMPLELQQIAISDPDVNPCTATYCGTPPKVSGDLRGWLPFAIENNATVIEMYYQDLGLAFDQNYCNNGGSQCYQLPTIIGSLNPNPYTWYCEVGYGGQYGSHGCTLGCEAGGCYSAKIISAHGPQQ
jgi:hypothetical protein